MLVSQVLLVLGAVGFGSAHFIVPNDDQDMSGLTVNSIPAAKRVEYMQKVWQTRFWFKVVLQKLTFHQANGALFRQSGPCPFAAFGTIIVNHTSDEVVCEGANFRTGDPTIHGEISAINACTAKFAEQGMTPTSTLRGGTSRSTQTLSLVRCARVQFVGLVSKAKYVYGTTIQHNYNVGWGVMTLSSYDVFQQSRQLPGYQTSMIGQILTNETDPLFSWQYNTSAPCPNECFRVPSTTRGGTTCSNVTVSRRDYDAL
ncbi:cytidine and deoxycytidylate deaminase zinc-binding region [Colletotrichum salicis]|uniref:Cytidine and deoxycytidylate deaminase zinc-binding region n=1 Tax=Colletotrichum salicis TaxID=1209931 RepID=A0A135RNL3_9PEZI|nr:cytidine and deoxycytidylate deaminase zinc-binding region [Colletotrichum salicis]